MNLLNAAPTPYVWKYNPVTGKCAGAQQNYGATIDWVLPGGNSFAYATDEIRRRFPEPAVTRAITARFEAESDQQPYAGPHETNIITADVVRSGPPPSAVYPFDPSGVQRVQLSGGMMGGRTEGRMQLSGGLTEGRMQLAGGAAGKLPTRARPTLRPPRWCGTTLTGNGLPADYPEMTPDAFKYYLRVQGPSQEVDEPGVMSQRQFMTTFLPAMVPHPFDSESPDAFPAYFSSVYKGTNAFEPVFWQG